MMSLMGIISHSEITGDELLGQDAPSQFALDSDE